MVHTVFRRLGLLAVGATVLLAGCERPPMQTTQQGFRGTGMQQTVNPRTEAALAAARPAVPPDIPAPPAEGPKAKDVYQNVKVLGNLPVADFTRHMVAMTQWVSPEQGCNYCHAGANFADDSKYQKVVARRMIEMTQHLNANWKQHVGTTGVTCYSCHRGQPVPMESWYQPLVPKGNLNTMLGNDFGQNKAAKQVGLSSLPYDPFTSYLAGSEPIRVYGKEPLPQGIGNGETIQHAEKTYALMMHFSKALGGNCTTCHNSQAFSQWTPKKMTAWHGISMARDINNNYLTPLTSNFPVDRLGPNGDVAKAFCATCHQGQNKPVGGLEMAKGYSGLLATLAGPPLPAPVAEADRTVLYFAVGSSDLMGTQAKGLEPMIAALAAKPRATLSISGYHSAAGDPASNAELAKKRAMAVRDALVTAGIKADRARLEKPRAAEANTAGEDPAARRVEVRVQ